MGSQSLVRTQHENMIRPADLKDISAIASLGARTFANTFGYSLRQSDLQDYLETAYSHSAMKNDLSNPSVDIFVAYDEQDTDHVMGFVQLREGTTETCLKDLENIVELQRLYVDEKYHGTGVGGALVRYVETLARQRGFDFMWLGVWEDNLKAQKAYERFGFKKVGEHDFKMGTCIQTDWILTRPL